MGQKDTQAKLIQVKLTLADKYERLATLAKSSGRKKRLFHHAGKFRRQVQDLSRL